MAFRSYMLAKLHSGLEREQVISAVHAIESMDFVLFCEPVVGVFDIVATVETDKPVEDVVRLISDLEHVQEVRGLKVNPLAARDRMWKNFKSIPVAPGK